jgi:enoyl-CoA hydratase/carnithine racemase
MLLLNDEMIATEAFKNGLAMEVFDSKIFSAEVRERVKRLADMPSKVSETIIDPFKIHTE